jgi:hypothetical protein
MLREAWSSRVLGNTQQLRALLGIRLGFVLTDVQGKCLLYYERIGIAYTLNCSETYSKNSELRQNIASHQLIRQPTLGGSVFKSAETSTIVRRRD